MDKELFYIDGYYLDKYQIECVKCDSNLLVVAGAGCGKTSTILGKVKYLINNGIKNNEILCISLTNEATNGLRNKLENIGFRIDCLTFHKLGLNIINRFYKSSNIYDNRYLEYIIDEYFESVVMYSYRKYYVMLLLKNIKYDEIIRSKDFVLFKKNISTFINLLKNKGYDIHYVYNLYKKTIDKISFRFILEIYKIYEEELNSNNSIDLNDMIIKSRKLVDKYKLKFDYKYIIIDEFQDSSKIRLELIQSIMRYNNIKVMCVGDDYQSIYRFAGSDIELFLNFNKYFKDSRIMCLKNTYRNSQELLFISNKFICKNKYQFKKELFSNKRNKLPIKIYFCNNKVMGLKKLINLCNKDYMIIGRNNVDIKYYVEKDVDINSINYYTAHKSKGLESNDIILINLTDNVMGFPSQIKNNRIINYLFDKDLYKYDEERRLFYVAITRTKNNVYMLVDRNNMSVFVKELIKDYKNYIDFIK